MLFSAAIVDVSFIMLRPFVNTHHIPPVVSSALTTNKPFLWEIGAPGLTTLDNNRPAPRDWPSAAPLNYTSLPTPRCSLLVAPDLWFWCSGRCDLGRHNLLGPIFFAMLPNFSLSRLHLSSTLFRDLTCCCSSQTPCHSLPSLRLSQLTQFLRDIID